MRSRLEAAFNLLAWPVFTTLGAIIRGPLLRLRDNAEETEADYLA